jgi:hypothetical protein
MKTHALPVMATTALLAMAGPAAAIDGDRYAALEHAEFQLQNQR